MNLLDAAKPEFRRHDGFAPRYGWFRKAFAATESDPHIFSSDDSPVRIGVGINMVQAIRTWGLAAKIIHESQAQTPKRAIPTRFANDLLGERGWDRFVEDQASLWLLHWRMMAPVCRIPAWWLAFNEFEDTEFAKDELEGAVTKKLADADWRLPTQAQSKETSTRCCSRTHRRWRAKIAGRFHFRNSLKARSAAFG